MQNTHPPARQAHGRMHVMANERSFGLMALGLEMGEASTPLWAYPRHPGARAEAAEVSLRFEKVDEVDLLSAFISTTTTSIPTWEGRCL